jgi:hypothetical protein
MNDNHDEKGRFSSGESASRTRDAGIIRHARRLRKSRMSSAASNQVLKNAKFRAKHTVLYAKLNGDIRAAVDNLKAVGGSLPHASASARESVRKVLEPTHYGTGSAFASKGTRDRTYLEHEATANQVQYERKAAMKRSEAFSKVLSAGYRRRNAPGAFASGPSSRTKYRKGR